MSPPLRPELVRRIVCEADAVRRRFPGRFRLTLEPSGYPAWLRSVPVEGQDFPVIVTYPPAYPAQPPTLETTAKLPPGCPHVLGHAGGRTRLCWIAPFAVGRRRRWDPQRHTAATVLRAAQRWGLALRVWLATGAWPVLDVLEVSS